MYIYRYTCIYTPGKGFLWTWVLWVQLLERLTARVSVKTREQLEKEREVVSLLDFLLHFVKWSWRLRNYSVFKTKKKLPDSLTSVLQERLKEESSHHQWRLIIEQKCTRRHHLRVILRPLLVFHFLLRWHHPLQNHHHLHRWWLLNILFHCLLEYLFLHEWN